PGLPPPPQALEEVLDGHACRASRPAQAPLPTRRSSDLLSYELRRADSGSWQVILRGPTASAVAGRLSYITRLRDLSVSERRPAGSEGHTSELQSRENLGCRVLPGKKKK